MGAAVLLAGLGLVACDMRQPGPPAPKVGAVTPAAAVPALVPPPPTVPSADSVLAPPTAAAAPVPTGQRTNAGLSAAQESSAMPLPGQVNDHSSPVASAPARRASAR